MAASRLAAPRLVGLLAAHFAATDHARVDRLRRLLQSVGEQTHRAPLLVSWSAEDEEDSSSLAGAPGTVAARASAILQEFEEAGIVHAMPRLRGHRAQFQHYSRLRKVIGRHVRSGQEPFIFFSDDDDIWHPRRAESYLEAARQHPHADVLASRVQLSPGFGPRLPTDATVREVSQLHESGHLNVAISSERPEGHPFRTATGEYFDIAAAWTVFDTFFQHHNERVFANRFADIRFRTYALTWPNGVQRFLPRGVSESGEMEPGAAWMYCYDRTVQGYVTPPSEEDLRYVCEDLPDPRQIAGMRQTLDCVLFQLAPTEGPLRISERVFAESLLGMLNEHGRAVVAMALDRCRLHGVQVGADPGARAPLEADAAR